MPRISQQKKDKISEQVLNHLFTVSPEAIFTSAIAKETARDEEFIKALLKNLKSKSLILEVNKNPKGAEYSRRQRWRLSDKAYEVYSQRQESRARN